MFKDHSHSSWKAMSEAGGQGRSAWVARFRMMPSEAGKQLNVLGMVPTVYKQCESEPDYSPVYWIN